MSRELPREEPEGGSDRRGSVRGRAARRPREVSQSTVALRQEQLAAGGKQPSVSSERDGLADSYTYDARIDFDHAMGQDLAELRCLPPEVSIFFYCELASLHSAINEDDLAVQLLWRARSHVDMLPSGHPDAAVLWCGLGRVAFYTGCNDIAARALSKARRIRERTIGGDTMETATTYNNLACCLSALNRTLEALAHLELAVEILRTLGGDTHPRTQAALRNLEKVKAAPKQVYPEVPHMFSFHVHDYLKACGRRRKKKGGKKGGSRGTSKGSRASSAASEKSAASSGASSRKSSRKSRKSLKPGAKGKSKKSTK